MAFPHFGTGHLAGRLDCEANRGVVPIEYSISLYPHNQNSMSGTVDWVSQIGRRLRLRDLHIFFTVMQSGSMAKAAAHLRVTQPSVSKAIGDLEALGGGARYGEVAVDEAAAKLEIECGLRRVSHRGEQG